MARLSLGAEGCFFCVALAENLHREAALESNRILRLSRRHVQLKRIAGTKARASEHRDPALRRVKVQEMHSFRLFGHPSGTIGPLRASTGSMGKRSGSWERRFSSVFVGFVTSEHIRSLTSGSRERSLFCS